MYFMISTMSFATSLNYLLTKLPIENDVSKFSIVNLVLEL